MAEEDKNKATGYSGSAQAENPHAPAPHRAGEAWSPSNPIPTVQKFTRDQQDKQRLVEEQYRQSLKHGLPRQVHDPITSGQAEIEDVHGDGTDFANRDSIMVRNGNLEQGHNATPKEFPTQGRPMNDRDMQIAESQGVQDKDGWLDLPLRGLKTNVTFYPLKQPKHDELSDTNERIFTKYLVFLVLLETFRRFLWDCGWIVYILLSVIAWCYYRGEMYHNWVRYKIEPETRRGETATQDRLPESAEWLNRMIGTVWKLLNSDIFASVTDTIEDVMQTSVPSIIHAVTIRDIGQGSNPVRILSLRYLPDDEARNLSDPEKTDMKDSYVNLEVCFAYHATSGPRSRIENAHMMIVFYTGLKNVLGVPFPVWVQLRGFVGTMRMRLQFYPDPPFVKNFHFTLMGLPKVDISVVPMNRAFFNVLNLPVVSTFVQKSISAAINEYVAPKSFTLDLSEMLVGSDIKADTHTVGVIWIKIHRATELSSQDANGKSDPYIVVSFSKYGKPLYSSRIIEHDLEPIWEETAAILVTNEVISSDENLSVQLWDSDRFTADDELGRVEFSLKEMMKRSGEMYHRVDDLVGCEPHSDMPGKLHWSVGFFHKVDLSKHYKVKAAQDQSRANQSRSGDKKYSDQEASILDAQPSPAKATAAIGSDAGSQTENSDNQDRQQDSEKPAKIPHISSVAPLPDLPSAVVSIQIHQAIGLDTQNLNQFKLKQSKFSPGTDADKPEEEEHKNAPSAYCNVILNDKLIYRTRTKPFANQPYFNAGTERFVRNYTNSVLMVTVRDSRVREHDVLLGVVTLKLSELFKDTCQVSKFWPIVGGLGYGQVRISLTLRQINMRIPRNELGWDIGTANILSEKIVAKDLSAESPIKRMHMNIYTSAVSFKISGVHAHKTDSGIEWRVPHKSMQLPCERRYASAITFGFHNRSLRGTPVAIASLWLRDILDFEHQHLRIPILVSPDISRLRSNYCGSNQESLEALGDVKIVGYLEVDLIFRPGLGKGHSKYIKRDADRRQVSEAWQGTVDFGVRESNGDFMKNLDSADEEERGEQEEQQPHGQQGSENDQEEADRLFEEEVADERTGKADRKRGRRDSRRESSASTQASASGSTKSERSSTMQRFRNWRQHQHYLHRNHRGAMQWKPVRTASWTVDGFATGASVIRHSFDQKARSPDVETGIPAIIEFRC